VKTRSHSIAPFQAPDFEGAFDLEIELKNVILVVSRFREFLHRQVRI